jgi:hypothetical protein
VPVATPTGVPEVEGGEESEGEQATPVPTDTPVPPEATAGPFPAVSDLTLQPTVVVMTPTPTRPRIQPTPTPQPTPTQISPITPMSVLTPSRCLILIVVGLVVFTVTYGIQMAIWWRRQR